MHPAPRVSVVVPFYNPRAEYLQDAVDSVLAQQYPHCEILLVDDGSTGPCGDLARDYARRHPGQIRYLEHAGHRNRGLSATRNLGVRESRGEYIAFLDADDVWLPSKLREQVAILDALPEAGMLYGNSEYWYSWSGAPADACLDHTPRLGIESGSLIRPPKLLPLFLLGRAAVPPPCSVLLRRATLEAIGGLEEQFTGMYEDQALYAKVCLAAPVCVYDTCWDRYRQHPDSMCATSEDAGLERQARRSYLTWLEEYLSKRRLGDAEVWRALRIEQWLVRHPSLGHHLRQLIRRFWR
jgi:glycosyltransferase involved in cell wall biosynthesis